MPQFVRFLFFLLSASLLSLGVKAAPHPNPNPNAEVEGRPPPPRPVPGCPSAYDLRFQNQLFRGILLRTDIPTFPGGYYGFTEDYFFDNFTITDTTTNYPAAENGKKLPAPGTWAHSRRQFAQGLTNYEPKVREIFGNIASDPNKVDYGGMQDNDCLTAFWKGTYTATLNKAYGGKKKGTNVSWKYTHLIHFRDAHLGPDVNGVRYPIQCAEIKMDWSAFYS